MFSLLSHGIFLLSSNSTCKKHSYGSVPFWSFLQRRAAFLLIISIHHFWDVLRRTGNYLYLVDIPWKFLLRWLLTVTRFTFDVFLGNKLSVDRLFISKYSQVLGFIILHWWILNDVMWKDKLATYNKLLVTENSLNSFGEFIKWVLHLQDQLPCI